MGLLNYLTFDGIKTSDYGVFISGEGTFNAPERRGEFVNIPGRNGAIFLDEGGFENIEVNYPAFIGSIYDGVFNTRLQNLRMELKSRVSYVRLADTYHPDEFRLALYRAGLEVEPHTLNRSGDFTMIFDAKPQRFLTAGEIPQVFNANGTITNPTLFDSKPLIKITGDGSVSIAPYRFTVSDNPGTIYIDCEIGEAYLPMGVEYDWTDESGYVIVDELNAPIQLVNGSDTVWSASEFVSFEDSLIPAIEPGTVNIGVSGTITMEITPRWYRI